MFIDKENQQNMLPKKILFVLILIFTMCSVKLCAEGMSPAEAQVARESFVTESKKYVGSPYVLGATGPDSFDCSGLVYFVARESLKIQLPRTARAIYNYCKIVPAKEREIGDLLFFKTNDSGAPITHVGIYIGNNQFISAISDGPNTGVIISSLKEKYWKPRYVATGKFLPRGMPSKTESEIDEEGFVKEAEVAKVNTGTGSGEKSQKFILDATLSGDWSLFKPNQFMINFRGVDLFANLRLANVILQPGVGLSIRINTGLKTFQLPLLFSITLNDYVRFYAGPVFSFAYGTMMVTGQKIKASIFPGVIGAAFSTPALNIGKVGIQLVQDIGYAVFNHMDNSALSFSDSIAAGLVFCTGVRVTLGNGKK